jgi:hypothetical protein
MGQRLFVEDIVNGPMESCPELIEKKARLAIGAGICFIRVFSDQFEKA